MTSGQGCAKIAVFGFAFVFVATGLGIMYGAVGNFSDGETQTAFIMLIAGLAFGGAGLAVFLLAQRGFKGQKHEEELRVAHPNEPWNWRDDWISGRVRSTSTNAAGGLWGFSILWNLISAPLLFFLPGEIIDKQNHAALIGLLFPVVGIGLLIAATRKTIQARKYGECVFQMEKVPGVLGGDVAGAFLVPRGLPPGQMLAVRLSCIREVKVRSGKGTSTSEHPEWEAEQIAAQLSPIGDGASQSAKVGFRLPFDGKPTGQVNESTRLLWRLEASANVPGVDFGAAFEIPVFQTEASSPKLTEEALRTEEIKTEVAALTPGVLDAVTVGPSAGGGTEFVLHPGKDGSGLLGSMTAALVFGAIGYGLWYAGAPFLFPLVFGGIGVVIILFMIFGMYGESRIVIEDAHVSVRDSLFGIMHGKRMPCSSIVKISINGEGSTSKRGHYTVVLTRDDGKTLATLQFLHQRHQADWLAEELRKAMEPWRRQTEAENPISASKL